MTDQAVRDLPLSALVHRAKELNSGLEYHVQLAVEHGAASVGHAIALGQVLEDTARRYKGEWEEWFEAALGSKGENVICLRTAYRYRALWNKRDKLVPSDGSEPECRSLTDAFIKCGILPAPPPAEKGEPPSPAVFHLVYNHSTTPPEEWSAEERQAYLDKTAPIVEMRAKVEACVTR